MNLTVELTTTVPAIELAPGHVVETKNGRWLTIDEVRRFADHIDVFGYIVGGAQTGPRPRHTFDDPTVDVEVLASAPQAFALFSQVADFFPGATVAGVEGAAALRLSARDGDTKLTVLFGAPGNLLELMDALDPDLDAAPAADAEPTHTLKCRWWRTTTAECEYRSTHHYCPHPEHACDCKATA